MSDSVTSDHNAPSFQALYTGSFQQINFSASNSQSVAFDNSTTLLKLFSTQDCWVVFGINPVSAITPVGQKGSPVLVRGGFAVYFGVPKGKGYKLGVVQDSSSGTLDILEGA